MSPGTRRAVAAEACLAAHGRRKCGEGSVIEEWRVYAEDLLRTGQLGTAVGGWLAGKVRADWPKQEGAVGERNQERAAGKMGRVG
jgi:hypothetical protein